MLLVIGSWVVGSLVGLSFLYALGMMWGALRTVYDVSLLRDVVPLDLADCPRTALVVPACNESETIEAATRTRMALEPPTLELVYVNDRSSDDTGAKLDALAKEDARMQVVHVTELPSGWIGKVHAMSRGLAVTEAEWLLFTDADVHLRPDALRRAFAYARRHQLDHLAVFPSIEPQDTLLDAGLATFSRIALAGGRVWRTRNPRSKVAIGVGAFNLVRRSALERAGGLEALRLEVVDDMGLAQRLKATGARGDVLIGTGLASLVFYPTIAALVRGSEKTAVMFGFRAAPLVALFSLVTALELTPFIAPWLPIESSLRALAALAALWLVAASVMLQRRLGHRIAPALLAPIGSLVMTYAAVRGGLRACRRGALVWRGTSYAASQLLPAQTTRFV